MQEHFQFIANLVGKGGPELEEYPIVEKWLNSVASEVKKGKLSGNDLHVLRKTFGDVLTPQTIYGHIFCKPHGYAGDFEIIDKIYRKHVSNNQFLKNWDINAQSANAANAVKNRKDYFIFLIQRKTSRNESIQILNVASGPARDLLEFFSTGEGANVYIDCVEYDTKTIAYASDLCRDYLTNINFIHSNAFKFKTEKKYDLIWSAGLFDYFDDRGFKHLLSKLLTFLTPQGELVIGNFSENNPTRNYMEIVGDWILNHRSREQLIRLAEECGVPHSNISIGEEPEGINLFLHIKK